MAPPRNSRFRQVNPAFAAAHGLKLSPSKDGTVVVTPSKTKPDPPGSAANSSCQKRLNKAVAQARMTGKLNGSNLGLFRLPDEVFDLRQGIKVDLSLEAYSRPDVNNFGSHGEESLSLVDFSDNPLGRNNEDDGKLDERIHCYQSVQSFRLRRCDLKAASNIRWQEFDQLKLLDLSGNSLSEFSLNLLPLKIQHLNLSSNQLSVLHTGDSNQPSILPQLNHLDVSTNMLPRLPLCGELQCPKLQEFRCSRNQLIDLPLEKGKESCFLTSASNGSLQVLDLSFNKLDTDLDLSVFASLQTVHLAENRLTLAPCIPASVTQVALGSNKIQTIQGLLKEDTTPSTQTASLVDLLLSDNQLDALDASVIRRLHHLQRLDIQCNRLKNLPVELGALPHLQLVSFTGNPLVSFKASDLSNTQTLLAKLRKRAPSKESAATTDNNYSATTNNKVLASALAHNPKVLNLKKMGLREVPDDLTKALDMSSDLAKGVARVVLDNNSLTALPDNFLTALPKLSILQANINRLTQLPGNLSHFSLVELSLARNGLSSNAVDSALFGSRDEKHPISNSLQVLDLSSNRLDTFPCFGSEFPSLRTINLSCNKITSVQHWIRFPKTLSSINLSENCLADLGELPLSLKASCPTLNTLLLRHNNLKQIVPTLGLLDTLNYLDLKGNPQRLVRATILEKSCAEILTYLKNRMSPEQLQFSQIRIQEIMASSSTSKAHTPLRRQVSAPPEPIKETPAVSQGTLSRSKTCDTPTTTANPAENVDPPQETPIHQQVRVQSEEAVATVARSLPSMFPAVAPESQIPAAKQEKQVPPPSSLLDDLQQNIESLKKQLENLGLSQAKRYALKKQLAMERSKLIREERKVAQQG